jgi:hypothetical protein
VVLLFAAAAVVAGVVLVARGRGGEMAEFPADLAPLSGLEEASAADIAMLRPPRGLWGYQVMHTDDALAAIARGVAARDAEIARLRWQLSQLPPDAADRPVAEDRGGDE